MNLIAVSISKLGQALVVLGIVALAAILLIVLVNGSWLEFLEPIRSRFEVGSHFLGSFWFPALLGLFVGLGFSIYSFGEWLKKSLVSKGQKI